MSMTMANIDSYAPMPSNGTKQEVVSVEGYAGGKTLAYRTSSRGKSTQKYRMVDQDGHCNISHNSPRKQNYRFLADIFTTLVDIKWRYNLTVFTLAYVLSWLIFGAVWWVLALQHGDLVPENIENPEWKPCVVNVHSFPTAFLFSLETQTTIGYGSRSVTEECWVGMLLVVCQSVVSCIVDAVMVGIVFAKIARPKKRAETLIFSKKAVITLRDGKLCLLLRIGDIRKSHILEAHVRGVVIQKRVTKEGEVIPLYPYDLDVGFDRGWDRIFLVWPIVVEHVIEKESPFYEMSASDLEHGDFELVIVLEGIVEATGMTVQKRTSYLPHEILWGYQFDHQLVALHDDDYHVNYSHFNTVHQVSTPRCSAKQLYNMRDVGVGEGDSTTGPNGNIPLTTYNVESEL
ncbi:inward rectifier potassium channel 18-like [Saccoglossus kowalevskii]|uniref:ATP-sensitive inward rectifier potassium channel 12-like n=1 Tax=Saccoglossus kowalevskii TaxID=10224 RepID=A0ABM0GUW4_SACKO|nr:PREDICTED: ATP-sensitive inward rectifier potassium channel 12-like [Saccoglossus kowalevskii]